MPIKAPYLPYDKLREEARKFHAEYHPSGAIPIPIEAIVENDFNIDIVPTPGLEKNFDIDSYPSSDLTEFHIDEYVYKRQPRRYRFSLAHELSHVLIHQDVFAQLTFDSISKWKVVVCSIPEDQYSFIEWQAYALAGLLLVPADQLAEQFRIAGERAGEAGISLVGATPQTQKLIESHIAKYFDVSLQVVTRRMDSDELWEA